MDTSTKQKLFNEFINEWETKFNKISFLLKYIESYPELTGALKKHYPLLTGDLINSQRDWISLVSLLDNPIDTCFFKPYWVPISKNSYDLFIDLSNDKLSIFEIMYYFLEPYRWYKKYIFKNVTELLLEIDNPLFNWEEQIHQNENESRKILKSLFRERDQLGFAGLLEMEPIEKEDLVIEGNIGKCEFNGHDILIFKGVRANAIGLLSPVIEITLTQFGNLANSDNKLRMKVKTIKALQYLIEKKGVYRINKYSLAFDKEYGSYAEFTNNQLIIHHNNLELLEEIKGKFERIIDGKD
jgi:hypothetical protein